MKSAANDAIMQSQKALQAIRALIGENVLLRQALIEIAGDPTGVSTYQAEIAKRALNAVGADKETPPSDDEM